MLTQQQADDYNLALHELESIEIWQQLAQKKMNEYYSAIEKVSSMMADATPEMMQRVRTVLPKLVEGYNAAKLKLTWYDDRHQQALSRVNEYKALEAQQTAQPTVKRRVVNNNNNNNNFDWNARWNNEYKNNEQPVVTPTPEVTVPEGWVVQKDWTITSPDMTSISVNWVTYPLKEDDQWRYYYNQTWDIYTFPNGKTFNPSNVKIYPEFEGAWQYKTQNWATIWPSGTHWWYTDTATQTFLNNFVHAEEPKTSPTINLSTNRIIRPATQFTYRPNTKKYSLYS